MHAFLSLYFYFAVLRRSGAVERVLLPVLDGNETGEQ